eukprot:4424400-Alexandrium_andersonii.AAC.1
MGPGNRLPRSQRLLSTDRTLAATAHLGDDRIERAAQPSGRRHRLSKSSITASRTRSAQSRKRMPT